MKQRVVFVERSVVTQEPYLFVSLEVSTGFCEEASFWLALIDADISVQRCGTLVQRDPSFFNTV